jgi:uncharacterized protein (DUF2267 family)
MPCGFIESATARNSALQHEEKQMAAHESARTFFDTIAKRLQPEAPQSIEPLRLRKIVRSVLYHLCKRLAVDSRERLLRLLPLEITALENYDQSALTGKPSENFDAAGLVEMIREENQLADSEAAKLAALAVIATITEQLPAYAALQIRTQLPSSVKQLWIDAVKYHATTSVDLLRFRNAIIFHFKSESPRQLDVIGRMGTLALLHRVAVGEEKRVLPYIPEEIRIAIGHEEPWAAGSELRNEFPSLAELMRVIQTVAELPSASQAETAVLGVFRAIKIMAFEKAISITEQLPLDWKRLWLNA